MYCIKCGKEIDNTSIFCPFCGTKVVKPAEPENSISLEQVQQKITDVYNENAPKVKEALNTAGETAEKLYQENAPKVKEALNTAADKAAETAETIRQTVAQQAPEVTKKVKSSRIPLIAAAVILVCALGFGAYRLLFGGSPSVERFEKTAEKYEEKWGEDCSTEISEEDEYYYDIDPEETICLSVSNAATWESAEFMLSEFENEKDAEAIMAYEREESESDSSFTYEESGGKEFLHADDYYGVTIGIVRKGKIILLYHYPKSMAKTAEKFIRDIGF